jgi:flagellar biosynthesis/type III secretory pathway protein FliH
MGGKLTKKEREQRNLEYRYVWMRGYEAGLKEGTSQFHKMTHTIMHMAADGRMINKVQKAVKDLEENAQKELERD